MELRALAKINLGLDVLGTRADGYHEVRMIMQTVYLSDTVKLEASAASGIRLTSNLKFLPDGETNIAYKAAKLLIDEFGITDGVEIALVKHIPVAAGLAGGSSDAAAVLFGMNRLFRLGLSREELMERGVKLGADVPYCILRGTVLAEGIGEKLSLLPPMPRCLVLLAKPPVSVSTKMVYAALDEENEIAHPDIDSILEGLRQQDLQTVAKAMGNVLETVTIPKYPVVEALKREMLSGGAAGAMMSGSGPTVFGLFTDKAAARKVQQQIWEKGLARQVYLTNIHNAGRTFTGEKV